MQPDSFFMDCNLLNDTNFIIYSSLVLSEISVLRNYCSPAIVPVVRGEVGHGYCHLFFVFSFVTFLSLRSLSTASNSFSLLLLFSILLPLSLSLSISLNAPVLTKLDLEIRHCFAQHHNSKYFSKTHNFPLTAPVVSVLSTSRQFCIRCLNEPW